MEGDGGPLEEACLVHAIGPIDSIRIWSHLDSILQFLHAPVQFFVSARTIKRHDHH
jgi:hypothetical protein